LFSSIYWSDSSPHSFPSCSLPLFSSACYAWAPWAGSSPYSLPCWLTVYSPLALHSPPFLILVLVMDEPASSVYSRPRFRLLSFVCSTNLAHLSIQELLLDVVFTGAIPPSSSMCYLTPSAIPSGVCWDPALTHPSGTWTQTLGLRPSFSGNSALLPSTPSGYYYFWRTFCTRSSYRFYLHVMLSTAAFVWWFQLISCSSCFWCVPTGTPYPLFGAPSPFHPAPHSL